MRAVRIHAYGGPEIAHIEDAETPRPGAGEVLVKVAAAGVNPVDWKIREGYLAAMVPLAFPITLGNEFAGTVEALGPGVEGFAVGERVHGSTGMVGSFAQYAVANAASIARIPDGIGFVEAAAIPVAATTSAAALTAGEVAAGTRVLVHSAAGGVGSLFLQLAKQRGAHVVALTSPATIDYVKELGADEVIDRTGDWAASVAPVDVVFDAFGGPAQERSWPLLKPGGIMVSLVQPPSPDKAAELGVRGTMVFGGPNGAELAAIDALIASGKVRIRIAREFPFEQTIEALAASATGTTVGKLVVTMGS
jgi:NADPH:quinone reductase-like Zn-dependent oxidoreductase